jgi:tetratricopeptide (TPR) repeat protein
MSERSLKRIHLRLALAAVLLVLTYPAATAQDADTAKGSVPPLQVRQAVERIRSATLSENDFARAVALGTSLLREGRFAEAADLFTALAEKKPLDPMVLYGAALATFNTGRTTDAEPLARRAVDAALETKASDSTGRSSNQRAADALVLLAVVLAVRHNDAGALSAAERAVNLAPDNFDAQLALGRAMFGMGNDLGAARSFRAAIALRPGDPQTLFFLATALEHGGDTQAALKTYRDLVALRPEIADGHLGLGVLLLKRGGADTDEGMKELERAVQIDTSLYEAHVTLGRLLVARGRPAEAIEHLQRAAKLAPANPEPHYQLSLAYQRLGRKDEASAESAIVKRIHATRRGVAPGGPNE